MRGCKKTVLICMAAEALNLIVAYIFYDLLRIPLFMDTIFTVAVTFYYGLIPGTLVALCYNLIFTLTLTVRGFAFDPFAILFGICGALVALVTWFFARRKENFRISIPVTVLYLLLIALVSSFVAVLSSGIIDFVRFSYLDLPNRIAPIKNFTDSFRALDFSLLSACFLAQIPVSMTDRIITTFLGYGVYRLLCRLLGEETWTTR